jgi:hypothetical protein
MSKIIIDVNNTTADKWRSVSQKLKTDISRYIDRQIASIIDKKGDEDIIQFLNELRDEMELKGLTQEKLDEILKDEQQ